MSGSYALTLLDNIIFADLFLQVEDLNPLDQTHKFMWYTDFLGLTSAWGISYDKYIWRNMFFLHNQARYKWYSNIFIVNEGPTSFHLPQYS